MTRRHGFTLMELLVVITIISLLTAMLLPAIGMVRASAKTAVCASNLRQVGMAFSAYSNDNEGVIPPYLMVDSLGNNANYQASIDAGVPHNFWFGALVGYLEDAGTKASKVYTCPASCFPKPSNKGWGLSYGYNRTSSFFLNIKNNLTNNLQTGYLAAQISRHSTQILIGERWGATPTETPLEGWGVCPPYETYIPQFTPLHPGGSDSALRISHNGSSNYLLFDGHVETMAQWKQVNQAQILSGMSTNQVTPNWWVGNP